VISAARPKGWPGGLGKIVTLRQAVDAAEAEVAKAFADRPLAEASIREKLGSTYLDLEAPAMTVKQLERAMALREAMLGDDHPSTIACRNKPAMAYRRAGRPTDASRLYDQDLNSSSHASALAVRGSVLLTQKKPAEAELKLRECLTIRQKLQHDDWTTFDTKSMLGEALLDQKKYAEAEQLLLPGYEGMKYRESKIPAPGKVRLTKALEFLVRLYEDWGKKDKASLWAKEMAKAAKKS
jgi:tetratricopeptide (TPR) repeat protein